MISEGSCDTEYCSNDAKNFAITGMNYFFRNTLDYIAISYFNNTSQYKCFNEFNEKQWNVSIIDLIQF